MNAEWPQWLLGFSALLLIGRIWSYKPMHDPDTRPIPPPKDYEERSRLERRYDKELIMQAIKEAHREWLNDIFSKFGRWSATGIAAATLALIAYLLLTIHGWKPPP